MSSALLDPWSETVLLEAAPPAHLRSRCGLSLFLVRRRFINDEIQIVLRRTWKFGIYLLRRLGTVVDNSMRRLDAPLFAQRSSQLQTRDGMDRAHRAGNTIKCASNVQPTLLSQCRVIQCIYASI